MSTINQEEVVTALKFRLEVVYIISGLKYVLFANRDLIGLFCQKI